MIIKLFEKRKDGRGIFVTKCKKCIYFTPHKDDDGGYCRKLGSYFSNNMFCAIGRRCPYDKLMSDIVDITQNLPHKVSEVICVKCGHRWLAVRPETTRLKELECPECHRQGFAIETGETNNVGGVDWEQWCD